ncbi:hypothetical protein [Chitinophaga sp.]|uniref:hypothetical protein n=1 Tax=Chitinophaga sp. TaxID=1869181 RepID=UPI002B7899C2|nr:hypothetical protein [Chitinophaga sp.]HWV69516.1 hypothetical protein [Chitinophaga sp.]
MSIKDGIELIKTNFKEAVIIGLAYWNYLQHGEIAAMQVQNRLDAERNKQEIVTIYRDVMNRQDQITQKAGMVVDKVDTLVNHLKQ